MEVTETRLGEEDENNLSVHDISLGITTLRHGNRLNQTPKNLRLITLQNTARSFMSELGKINVDNLTFSHTKVRNRRSIRWSRSVGRYIGAPHVETLRYPKREVKTGRHNLQI